MSSLNLKERFKQASMLLCTSISRRLIMLPDDIQEQAQEIRLRLNRPTAVCCPDNTYYLTENGCVTNRIIDQPMLKTEQRDMTDIFHNICNFSVYSRQNEIKNGFVTMQGGHRAGICGTAVTENEKITNIRDISSINIRIAREHRGSGNEILRRIKNISGGVLICGSPCSGKTTVLRDIARNLSLNYDKKVSIVDERGEIAGTVRGVFQNDIGMCDVLDGYSKAEGIIQSIRSMSPDVLICDEIGGFDDVKAILQSANSGVSFIATVHCKSKEELAKKVFIKELIKSGVFEKAVFLQSRKNAGKISSVIDCGELLYA